MAHRKIFDPTSAAWQRTMEEISHGFDPAVIDVCEVGEVNNYLEAQHLDALQDLTRLESSPCGTDARHVDVL